MSAAQKKAKPKRSGSETRQRSKRLTIRLTDVEYAEIEAAADREGLAVGSHGRAMLLTGRAPRAVRTPPVDRQALAQNLGLLGRLGSNVNQISRALNFGERYDEAALAKAMREIGEMRNALMAALGREVPA